MLQAIIIRLVKSNAKLSKYNYLNSCRHGFGIDSPLIHIYYIIAHAEQIHIKFQMIFTPDMMFD
jgi:hypothetical protein